MNRVIGRRHRINAFWVFGYKRRVKANLTYSGRTDLVPRNFSASIYALAFYISLEKYYLY